MREENQDEGHRNYLWIRLPLQDQQQKSLRLDDDILERYVHNLELNTVHSRFAVKQKML